MRDFQVSFGISVKVYEISDWRTRQYICTMGIPRVRGVEPRQCVSGIPPAE